MIVVSEPHASAAVWLLYWSRASWSTSVSRGSNFTRKRQMQLPSDLEDLPQEEPGATIEMQGAENRRRSFCCMPMKELQIPVDPLSDDHHQYPNCSPSLLDSAQKMDPSNADVEFPAQSEPVSSNRYFDALQGAELEVLKEDEDNLVLPPDQTWPFLLRFPVNTFGIVLGLGSQGILWKSLASTPSLEFLHVSKHINFILWCITLFVFLVIFLTYSMKCLFYFEAVRREYYHPVRVNYFFAPWIGALFLAIGLPEIISTTIHPSVWCVFMAPLVLLELKIYGQWLSGGDRRLSSVANPSTHLSIVGNFVGGVLGAKVGWREPAMFLWSIGLAHYFVLFVTLYQRLPTNKRLSQDLHPVFFLFIAAPSTASVAWEAITGSFDHVSRFVYFISLFLLLSLVVRLNLFCGFRFSIAWWAYTFPLGAVAIATIRYDQEANTGFTRFLVLISTLVSVLVVFAIFVLTLFYAFLWGTLFPNDLAIAIMEDKQKRRKTKSLQLFIAPEI